jgi:hypothetical protein
LSIPPQRFRAPKVLKKEIKNVKTYKEKCPSQAYLMVSLSGIYKLLAGFCKVSWLLYVKKQNPKLFHRPYFVTFLPLVKIVVPVAKMP